MVAMEMSDQDGRNTRWIDTSGLHAAGEDETGIGATGLTSGAGIKHDGLAAKFHHRHRERDRHMGVRLSAGL